ncbi:MAG: nucleotidyltransferase domain-containing protein [Chloroflexota bacterium]
MPKTALDLTAKELMEYWPVRRTAPTRTREMQARAWLLAREVARLLRQQFGATRVMVFGSLAHRMWFSPWSDIDMAAWGIPSTEFYRAVATVTGLQADFEVNLVDPTDCHPALRQAIEQEGIDL